MQPFNGVFNDLKKKNKFTVAGIHEYKETDSIKSVKSSLKSQPFWVILYVHSPLHVFLLNYLTFFSLYHDLYMMIIIMFGKIPSNVKQHSCYQYYYNLYIFLILSLLLLLLFNYLTFSSFQGIIDIVLSHPQFKPL